MVRQKDWNKLKAYARKLGVKLTVLTPDKFHAKYDSDIFSLFDPPNEKIVINGRVMDDEDVALYSFAHELGHAIDHLSEPHHSEEYAFHYQRYTTDLSESSPSPSG